MLPIKKVILYKHGVGYFEREGEVEGDINIQLQFKSDEMNDVLKSLTVLDLSGGHIASISYESTKPLEKQMEEIAIRLSDDSALTELLSQLKGASVKVSAGSEEVEGIITGIETINKTINQAVITTYLLTLLVDGGTVRMFDILEIKSLTFLNENLKSDLNHLLEILIASKKKDAKTLTIYARGEGTRTLSAGYVVETPVWKASYRVLLEEEKPTIQGWALVDNTQKEDWKDVSLTLVAGLPISFVHDLYSPRFKRRPVVQVKEEEAYAPPVLEEGMAPMEPYPEACEERDMELASAPMMADMAFGAGMPAPSSPPMKREMSKTQAFQASTQVQTRTVEVGDLFQYEIKNPVTVKRNQSALVPILQTSFQGKRVAVYNPEIRDKNPMSSLFIKNDTGLTLEGGPLTVMEKEVYVGESMLDTLKPQEERLVPFSVELSCLITRDTLSENKAIHYVRIVGGYMYLDYFTQRKITYKIKNKKDQPIDLFLEHRFNHGWELVDTPKPYETTDNFYRFRLDIPANKYMEFTVTEKHQEYQSYSLWYLHKDNINYWLQSGYIDDKIKGRLDEILKISVSISDLDRQIQEADSEVREIHNDQNRIRENLKSLGDSSDEKKLRERYVQELNRGEDQLKKLRQLLKDLKSKKQAVERDREKAISSLEINRKL